MTLDDVFADVARQVPGFAGAIMDESNGQLVVLLTKSSPEAAVRARTALGESARTSYLTTLPATARPVRYDFLQLKDWYDRISMTAFTLPGMVMTDIDEANNRLVVGVTDFKYEAAVRDLLTASGVPQEVVRVERMDPVVPQSNLQDYHRPLAGGLQVFVRRNQSFASICSLGFVAIRFGTLGFVTNSHCTEPQGGSDSDPVGQPDLVNHVGYEDYDPPLFTSPCVSGYQCRYSDAAFVRTLTPVTVLRGWVARPSEGSPAWNGQSYYRLTGKADPLYGSHVEKIGRTTGLTRGLVDNTCINAATEGNIVMLCQARASYSSAGGDSGGPVVSIEASNDRALRGIHWGAGGGAAVFSPIGNIEYGPTELGSMQVCEPSFSC